MAAAWSKVVGFLRRNKKVEEGIAEAAGMTLGWKIVTRVLAVGVASAAVAVPALIDLSNNNGPGAASAIGASGVQAVEAKATEGLSFQDGDYTAFRTAAAKAKRTFGGYLFLHPTQSGAAQADYFLAYAKPKAGDIEPVVDSETGAPAGAAFATYAALHELTLKGYRPLLYASAYYLGVLVQVEPRLKAFRVWQAEYGPTLHRAAGVTTVAWQYTDRTIVNGRRLDGSKLLVPVASLTIPRAPPPLTRHQKAVKKLKAENGYWPWLQWYIGEGDWKGYRPHAAWVRPQAPRVIPRAWWKRERTFLRARN